MIIKGEKVINCMEKFANIWRKNDSMVCVGLDPDLGKLPECVKGAEYPIFEFNKAIIDATAPYVCAYKPQAAYYAGQDCDDELAMTIDYILKNYPEIPVILDVKRGDIGSTAEQYAKEAFDRYHADAVTVNPYMGSDAINPFLKYADKGVVVLCRTSNPGSKELQELVTTEGKKLYEHVALLARDVWNKDGNVMMVLGATFPEELKAVRELCPDMPFLVPGVGAQGGDVEKVVSYGRRADGYGLIVNSSRGIIYASKGDDFAAAAGEAAKLLRDQMRAVK